MLENLALEARKLEIEKLKLELDYKAKDLEAEHREKEAMREFRRATREKAREAARGMQRVKNDARAVVGKQNCRICNQSTDMLGNLQAHELIEHRRHSGLPTELS